MALYVVIPNPRSADEVAALGIQYLQAWFPQWVPNAGALATIMLETNAREAGELWQLASEVEDAIFRQFGPLVGVYPVEATPATGATTWTMVDNAGYTIPAGTQVGVRTAGDTLVPFRTVSDVTVPVGGTATGTGEVVITALNVGAAGSGLGGAGSPVELIDPLTYVEAITLAGITTGGVDAESDEDYLDRLATELRLLTPRPILPQDFAVLACTVPGVERCLALDLYNPADDTWDNERMVTVVPINEGGYPVNSGIKAQVDSLLQGLREANFVVNVTDATYTTVDVATTFTVLPGYDPATVEANVRAAITTYLSPANWGVPPNGDQREWVNTPVVRYLELTTLVNNVEGVDYVTALGLGTGAHKTYTLTASGDQFTSTGHGYSVGDALTIVAATGGAPLNVGDLVYIQAATTNTFKVTLTPGGGVLDITSDGTGTVQKVTTGDLALAGVAPLPQPGAISAAAR